MKKQENAEEAAADAGGEENLECLSIEKCFEELEHIVEALENESIPLDKSIEMFERGMKLSRRCSKELTQIEKKIQIIIENSKGEAELKDFEQLEQ